MARFKKKKIRFIKSRKRGFKKRGFKKRGKRIKHKNYKKQRVGYRL